MPEMTLGTLVIGVALPPADPGTVRPLLVPAGCAGCRFAAECPGLRQDYVERFGGDEVRAVVDAPAS